jgi:hypothetical protein
MIQDLIIRIFNRTELIAYLEQEANSYSKFILERICRDPTFLVNVTTQSHHIIPRHMNGPNAKWNRIQLTQEEHQQAHQLLYENYSK